jgi:hypothetical protein
MRGRTLRNAAKAGAVLLAGVGVPAFAGNGWTALELDPPGIVLQGAGAAQKFIVTARDDQAHAADVSRSCRLLSSDPNVLTVDSDAGIVVGRSPGRATIEVSFGRLKTSLPVEVRNQSQEMSVSFSRDVMSILTTKGCNSSACHGSPAGQNGFKLSLFGYDVAADHKMVVNEHDGRRVDFDKPEDSLLLRKPSFQIAHGGGKLMTPESDAYRTLHTWLQQRAPLDTQGPRMERLEMYPRERILIGRERRQPLVVIGRFSDGTSRDMSGEVRYSVADEAIVSSPDAAGIVTATGRGLTTVMARAVGKVATSQMIVVDSSGSNRAKLPENNFIDRHVFKKLRQVNIAAYPVASDRMFIRRVFLDAVGRLPTPGEVEEFLGDPRADKRGRLIDHLLESRDYASQWLVKFEDWFRNAQYNSQGRTNASFKKWIRLMVEEDWPYDETVRRLLTSTGDTTVRPAGNFWHPAMDFMLRTFEPRKITPTVSRLFLGVRLDCAECHNHPLENLTQDDFFGMAAFFARLKVKHGYGQYRRIWYSARNGDLLHPVTKQPVAPRFLDGTTPAIPEETDRREALSNWITRTQKLQFARATVNRIWAEYFGRGLVDPPDDFRSTNMATHPDLLDELARHFIESGFRFKELHRTILNSQTYQLSSRDPSRKGEADNLGEMLYARYVPRKLPAEVMLDSIVQVTASAHRFGNYPPGTSPKEVVATNGPDYFLTVFGFPRRDILAPRDKSPSLSQALHMMNSETIRGKVEAEKNVLTELMDQGLDDRTIVGRVFERAYAREPTAGQWGSISKFIADEQLAGRSRRRALENMLWAVLNSKEFQLNQ